MTSCTAVTPPVPPLKPTYAVLMVVGMSMVQLLEKDIPFDVSVVVSTRVAPS